MSFNFQRESDKIKELKSQIQFLSSREKYAREELEEYKKIKDNSRSDFETKIMELKKGNMKLQDEVQKVYKFMFSLKNLQQE